MTAATIFQQIFIFGPFSTKPHQVHAGSRFKVNTHATMPSDEFERPSTPLTCGHVSQRLSFKTTREMRSVAGARKCEDLNQRGKILSDAAELGQRDNCSLVKVGDAGYCDSIIAALGFRLLLNLLLYFQEHFDPRAG
jgi:hypothetical protein